MNLRDLDNDYQRALVYELSLLIKKTVTDFVVTNAMRYPAHEPTFGLDGAVRIKFMDEDEPMNGLMLAIEVKQG